jgi:hypothetical protein
VWSGAYEGGAGLDTLRLTAATVTSGTSTVLVTAAAVSNGSRSLIDHEVETIFLTGTSAADDFRVAPRSGTTINVDGLAPTAAPGDRLLLDTTGVTGTALASSGTASGTFTFNGRSPVTFASVETRVLLPSINAATLVLDGGLPRRITLETNVDVRATLSAADVRLSNLDTGGQVGTISLSFDSPTIARVVYTGAADGTLPDGNYRLTVPAGSFTDAGGTPSASDMTYDFFVLDGDANRDRTVDFLDLAKLAQNYNASGGGKTYADGDFNGDGNVDFLDLAIMAQRYNTSLPAPGAAQPVAASSTSFSADWAMATASIPAPVVTKADAKKVKPKPVFSVTPVVKPVPMKTKARQKHT